jgi:hypothetical protein
METEKKLQAKKEWTKPELIVLVRSTPEEAVLLACKGTGAPVGNAATQSQCWWASCTYECNVGVVS